MRAPTSASGRRRRWAMTRDLWLGGGQSAGWRYSLDAGEVSQGWVGTPSQLSWRDQAAWFIVSWGLLKIFFFWRLYLLETHRSIY